MREHDCAGSGRPARASVACNPNVTTHWTRLTAAKWIGRLVARMMDARVLAIWTTQGRCDQELRVADCREGGVSEEQESGSESHEREDALARGTGCSRDYDVDPNQRGELGDLKHESEGASAHH